MEISTQYNTAQAVNSYAEDRVAPKRVQDKNAIKVKDAKAGGAKTEEKKAPEARDTERQEKPPADTKRISIFA